MPLTTLLEIFESLKVVRRRQLYQAGWQGLAIILLSLIGLRVYGVL